MTQPNVFGALVTEMWRCKISLCSGMSVWSQNLHSELLHPQNTLPSQSSTEFRQELLGSCWVYSDSLQRLGMDRASVFKAASGINANLCHKGLKVQGSGCLPPRSSSCTHLWQTDSCLHSSKYFLAPSIYTFMSLQNYLCFDFKSKIPRRLYNSVCYFTVW